MTLAIVIGGTAGVGRAIVDALRAREMTVGVIARGEDRLSEVKAAYPPGTIRTAAADAGDAAALRAAVDSICTDEPPAVWVNCAMATSFSRFQDMEVDEFDRIVRTTFLGQVNGTRLALRHMRRGNIVHIGSGLSYRPVPGQSAYVASKHAINGFVGSVRSEMMETRPDLHFSLIQLPAMDTPQFDWARNRFSNRPQPAPPVFAPQVAADATLKAIDGNLREVLVGGSVFKLVFGDMAVPAYIDRKLAKSGIDIQQSDRPDPGGRPDNLFGPQDLPARVQGSYRGNVRQSATTMDADLARVLALGGLIGAAFVLGRVLKR